MTSTNHLARTSPDNTNIQPTWIKAEEPPATPEGASKFGGSEAAEAAEAASQLSEAEHKKAIEANAKIEAAMKQNMERFNNAMENTFKHIRDGKPVVVEEKKVEDD